MAQSVFMKNLLPILAASICLTACGGSNAPKADTSPSANPSSELTPVQRGAKVYTKCRACHTLDENGRHKVGPNLWGFYGSKTASKEGFAYSKAMKAADITWDEKTVDEYLKKPASFIPGNKMTFIGLKKQEERDAVQAYLREKTTP